jgi:hypothetical protein
LLQQELLRNKTRAPSIWSAASSFGDEAYSIAMLLADMQTQGSIGPDWRILGTDISDRVLRSATEAIYPEDRLRHVSPERLRRYCLRGEDESEGLVQIHPRLLEHVSFGQLNLCQPVDDIGPFDVIFLRNVLIYFDAPTKRAVVDRVLTQLRPGGLFFIGIMALNLLSPRGIRSDVLLEFCMLGFPFFFAVVSNTWMSVWVRNHNQRLNERRQSQQHSVTWRKARLAMARQAAR